MISLGESPTRSDEPLLQRPLSFDTEYGLSVPRVAVWMVYLAVFMDNMGGQISTPVMPYYAKSFGVGNAQIGWLFSVFQLTGIFCAPILGRLSDRFGRRKVLFVSIIGAGIASMGQGFANSFSGLLVMRGFGGIWGAVLPVAKVYMADVCTPAVLPEYLAYLSSVPGAAQTFGPAFGGGLTTFGLNVPLLVDGGLSFAIAILVFFYMHESPAWQKGDAARKGGKTKGDANTRTPRSAYLLGVSQLCFSMGLYSTNAMLPIVLNAKYGFDAVHVGYIMTVIAIMRLVAGIWIAVPLGRRLGMNSTCALGALITGVFLIVSVCVENVWLCIAALSISRMGSNVRTSAAGAMQAAVSRPENRGKVFSTIQVFQNIGKLIGPLVAGYLAEIDAAFAPFVFSGVALLVSSALEVALNSKSKHSEAADNSKSDGPLTEEDGTPENYEHLGRFVGKLLKDRHYRWISQKDAVYAMLDNVLPELSSDCDRHALELEQIILHAKDMPKFNMFDSKPFSFETPVRRHEALVQPLG